ncbi:MAG: nitronate monooxygenase [Dactylosporangium sp.]|nr:nitronate monooxygenase [Dactylosporangium sp.]NNJ59747.1 nitronate monooxygenase [Dactylosporangium sp.]
MGVGISGWRLARAVAKTGQLGVVSGVALDTLLARRLQLGDPDGHARRALAGFPVPEIAERALQRYFVPGGIPSDRPFRPIGRLDLDPSQAATELAVLGNFVEIFLAKEGHDGPVGINLLEKMQITTPTAAYGAMLAGVDYVVMGAGIPSEIPALLNRLAAGEPGLLSVSVDGASSGERRTVGVDPRALLGPRLPEVGRPRFLAIVSTHVLAAYLARDPVTRPDGVILETPVAGGHSAPPRGNLALDADGDPIYGARDRLDLVKTAAVNLPFWLAGGYATPQMVAEAIASGATGVQIGSAFALCRESGLAPQLRHELLKRAVDGSLIVRNHPRASPTGFPFKLAQLPSTGADEATYQDRPRLCDLGYLRTVYIKPNGSIGYRCAAEPVAQHVRKGGTAEDTEDRRCLCNGLVASTGLGQRRSAGYAEPPLVTLGQDLDFLPELLSAVGSDYRAADVVEYLLPRPATEQAP